MSPKRKIRCTDVVEEEEERPVLVLKPFAAKPQITFKNVPVNTEVSKFLYILNPDAVEITVSFYKVKIIIYN